MEKEKNSFNNNSKMAHNAFQRKIFKLASTKSDKSSDSDKSRES